MEHFVTHYELAELKAWLSDTFVTKSWLTENFVTKKEFAELKKDVSELKGEVSVLKYDVNILKEDLAAFKQEMREFKSETTTRFDKVFGFLEKLDQERIFTHEAILRIEEKLSKL